MLTRKSLWVRLTLGQPRLMLMALAMLMGFAFLPFLRAAHGADLSVGAPPSGLTATAEKAAEAPGTFKPFGFLTDPSFSDHERIALFVVLGVSLLGLSYAIFLVGFVKRADRGTVKMQEVAAAIRDGATAYLRRQRNTLMPMIAIITVVLVVAAFLSGGAEATTPIMPGQGGQDKNELYNIAFGRGVAFLMGSFFSLLVGTVGMFMATRGNLGVAAAAPKGFGRALQLGYRSGTVTGMLTDGLGLLGSTLIFMYFGESAPSAVGVWFRRDAAGAVHAGGRRHLYQGGRCGGRPGGKN